jgi:putative DNA primase/helicase
MNGQLQLALGATMHGTSEFALPVPHQIADFRQLTSDLDPLKREKRWIGWQYVVKMDQEYHDNLLQAIKRSRAIKRGLVAPEAPAPVEWTKEPRSRYGRKYGKPQFWFAFENVCTNFLTGCRDLSGIAFVQTPDCDWGFIDLDDCIVEWENDRPMLAKWAQPIVEAAFKAGAYVEITVSKHGVRILGKTRRTEEQSLSRNIRDGDYAVEVYARTTRFVTVSGIQRGRGSPEANIDAVFDLIERDHPEPVKEERAHVSSEPGWRIHPASPAKPLEPTLENEIRGPVPHKVDKSARFHGIVGELFGANWSIAEIAAVMEKHENGIAQRYIEEGRVEKMTENSFGKFRAGHEARLAAAAPQLARVVTVRAGSIYRRPIPPNAVGFRLRLVSSQETPQQALPSSPQPSPPENPATPLPQPEPIPLPATPLFSDDYLASVFISRHAHELRYTATSGCWHRYDGKRWERDETLVVYDLAKISNREIANTAKKQEAKQVASAKTRAAVVSLAQSDRQIAAKLDQWDADPWLLNTPGGVVDLRTGEMREHRPEDYMTKMTAVAPDFSSPPLLFLNFLRRITNNDNEVIEGHKRFLGYCLTGIIQEHKMAFWWGPGRNGKGVLLNTVTGILADYHEVLPIEALLASMTDRHPTEIARLHKARLATASEVPKGRSWDETKIKDLTGPDKPYPARFMRKDFFNLWPEFKLIVTGNEKPRIRSNNEAIESRIDQWPFSVVIPKAERDKYLADTLKKEWPKILAWMIKGCLAWQYEGLNPPKAVTEATAAYFADQNLIAQFIEECCTRAPGSELTARLFNVWTEWARRAGEPAGRRKEFIAAMEKELGNQIRTNQGAAFTGVKLKTESWITNAAEE